MPVHHLHLHPQTISLVVQVLVQRSASPSTISLVVRLLVQQSASPSTINLADAKYMMCGTDLVADRVEEQGAVRGQWLAMLVM